MEHFIRNKLDRFSVVMISLAYYATASLVRIFRGPGVNVIKLFMVVSYEFSHKARPFVPGKLSQPSLIFW